MLEEPISPRVTDALAAMKKGDFILIYDQDGREEETDLVVPSQFVGPKHIFRMRRDGGGLICTTLTNSAAKKLAMPFLSELFLKMSDDYPLLGYMIPDDIPYDEISSFSLTINHRKTYTGITDNDRAFTVSRFAEMLHEIGEMNDLDAKKAMGKEFRAPGHIHLLNCTESLLTKRQGHTELSTAMTIMAGLTPSATICEMMGDDGKARSKESAQRYALDNGYIWLEGREVIDAWKQFKERSG